MDKRKIQVSWTIDEEIIKYLEKKSKIENRSISYIVNEILEEESKK